MDLLTTCPECAIRCYVPKDTRLIECHCGCSYDPWDDEEGEFDGPFDGFNVYSDADPGL